jgi:rRNA maturation protein Nop10
MKSEPMRRCLEKQLYSLAMPTPDGGSVTFSYPFEFHPSD